MTSAATRRFWELFQALPEDIQNLAVKNDRLWRQDPSHPLLRCRRLHGSEDRFSIQTGDRHRAIATQTDETTIWVWIGAHSDYDRLVGF